jgi:VWFA-related protein
VTDLTRADFTVLEDGVAQRIEQFAAQALVAEAAAEPGAEPPLRRADPAVTPQNRRVFLLLLGRGRMTGPSKELEALIEFVRTRMLPQDYIAVLAYNRGTDFSRNHEAVAKTIEAYRKRHEKIEGLLVQHFSGLRAVYGAKDIPPNIQREIDTLFGEAATLRPREIQPGQITDAPRIAEDVKRTADALQRAELLAERTGDFAGLPDIEATETAARMDLPFDEYVARQRELMQDVGNLYAGIDYLRFLDGEKRLVFVTPKGLGLPRLENSRSLADAAADARVVLDIIFTGGVVGAPPPRPVTLAGRTMSSAPVATPAMAFDQMFNVQEMRYAAEMTGGHMSAFEATAKALDAIDTSTRFHYLLGYTPANPALDRRYRKVEVKVNRPGVTVIHRRGYYATPTIVSLDRRAFITQTRMARAGNYDRPIEDIAVSITAPKGIAPGERELVVPLHIKSSRIKFAVKDGRHVAALDVALYCGDGKETIVGRSMQRIDLNMTDETHRRFLAEGLGITTRVPLTGSPAFVKAIVYDYAADVLGTATLKLK